ncbi:MAG: diguanylate cyclase [Methylococcales bacterium]|nr:diguanylate cyclase [Methylococcales bacterium]
MIFASASCVVNEDNKLQFVTEGAKQYLQFRGGDADLVIFNLIPIQLQAELKAVMYKVRRINKQISGNIHLIDFAEESHRIQIVVSPLKKLDLNWLIVSFVLHATAEKLIAGSDENENFPQRVKQLEQELTVTQESLQTVIQELETANFELQGSNEELQIFNEELQSSNEELQTTNEELQSTNEELQSTNEELLTVNDELQQKNILLSRLAEDFKNLYTSAGIPFLILDENNFVTRFHPELVALLNIDNLSVGAHLTNIAFPLAMPFLLDKIDKAIRSENIYSEVIDLSGNTYNLTIRPFYSQKQLVSGTIFTFVDISEHTLLQKALKKSQTFLANLFDNLGSAVITIDMDGKITSSNQNAVDMFGYSHDDIIGLPVEKIMSQGTGEAISAYLKTGRPSFIDDLRQGAGIRHSDEVFPFGLHLSEMKQEGETTFSAIFEDLTEKRALEKQVSEQEASAYITLNSIHDAVLRLDSEWNVIYLNQAAKTLIVTDDNDDLINQPIKQVLRLFDESSLSPINLESCLENDSEQVAILICNEDKKFVEFQISAFGVLSELDLTGYVLVLRDATERKQIEKKIQWENMHDPLTGLINRNELLNRLEQAIIKTQKFDQTHALLFLDLDQFKVVNDTCGHLAGDELLRQLSHDLSSTVRSRDVLARLGGDEFAILVENCPVEQAEYIAENILKKIECFRFTYDNKLS